MSRTVLLLGIVSLLTDISAEMVATIMPLYLLYTVGLTPLQYGLVDGVYQAGAALVRIAAGFIGDRWHRHKQVAAVGYGILGGLQARVDRCRERLDSVARRDPDRSRREGYSHGSA